MCEQCFSQNELSKVLYENKRIFIRQKDDDSVETAAVKDDCEIINLVRFKKEKFWFSKPFFFKFILRIRKSRN